MFFSLSPTLPPSEASPATRLRLETRQQSRAKVRSSSRRVLCSFSLRFLTLLLSLLPYAQKPPNQSLHPRASIPDGAFLPSPLRLGTRQQSRAKAKNPSLNASVTFCHPTPSSILCHSKLHSLPFRQRERQNGPNGLLFSPPERRAPSASACSHRFLTLLLRFLP